MGSSAKHSFLVTLWSEPRERDPDESRPWRGSVEHLGSKRRLYFTGPNELVSFIARYAKGDKQGKRNDPPEF